VQLHLEAVSEFRSIQPCNPMAKDWVGGEQSVEELRHELAEAREQQAATRRS